MKTKANPVNVDSAEQPVTKYISGKYPLKYFLIFLTLFQFTFNISNAQQENRLNDSILASKRECAGRDAREVKDWTANYGVSLNSTITGSGNGFYYCPSLFMHSKFGFISIGPIFQKQKMNFSGYQIQYEYNLLDGNLMDSCKYKRLELFTLINTTYQYNAILSATAQKDESFWNNNNPNMLNTTYLKTIEAYAGVGMRVHLVENFKMFGCIGFGGYRILVAPKTLYHDKQGMGLLLRIGISYEFDKSTKTTGGETTCVF